MKPKKLIIKKIIIRRKIKQHSYKLEIYMHKSIEVEDISRI